MRRNWVHGILSVLAAAAIAGTMAPTGAAQDVSMRAYLRGMGVDHGKCTVEVEVDNVVEIDFSADNGRIRTLSGQPGIWRRFECSGPIPARPAGFRFQGVDGRGNIRLLREPGRNRGVAVVRIEDTKGGREGYTFDLEWQDGPGNTGPPPRLDDDRDTFVVACDSNDGRRHYCGVDTRGGVRLLRQRPGATCTAGFNWGYDRRGIWVDRGCRAEFAVRR